jgi:hypothetical protein
MAAEDRNGEVVVSTQGECPDYVTSASSKSSFDELAKGLAHGTISRSRALRMLGAALLGGAFASIPGAAWAACKPLARKCTANYQCCSRNCIKNPQGNGKICGCPTGKTLCGGRCVTNCTAPKVLNTSTCSCECPPDEACTTIGGTVNPTTCECECPTGKTICQGQCVPNACSSIQTFNPATCRCETKLANCTPGTNNCCPGMASTCYAVEGGAVCATLIDCTFTCNHCPSGSICLPAGTAPCHTSAVLCILSVCPA